MAQRNNEETARRRESFDGVAGYYNVYRSPYPQEVVDAAIALSNLHQGSRVLEIGCGTGQLSVPLAEAGVDLLAMEPGPHLAALARRNLEPFPNARVETSSFEAWPIHALPSVAAQDLAWTHTCLQGGPIYLSTAELYSRLRRL